MHILLIHVTDTQNPSINAPSIHVFHDDSVSAENKDTVIFLPASVLQCYAYSCTQPIHYNFTNLSFFCFELLQLPCRLIGIALALFALELC